MSVLTRDISTLASRSHGVLTTSQMLDGGRTRHQIHAAAVGGELIRAHPGVYLVAAAPRSWEQRVLIAVHAAGPGALASHRSAAALWGLDGSTQGVPEVVTPRHLWSWAPALGRCLALVRHSRRGRRGVGPLRAILEECYGTAIPDSHFNRLVQRLLIDSGLPSPVIEHEVRDHAGVLLGRLDLAYPEWRIGIELDSLKYHLNRQAFESDRTRQNQLVLQGWTILRFSWHLYTHHPQGLVGEVAAALRQHLA